MAKSLTEIEKNGKFVFDTETCIFVARSMHLLALVLKSIKKRREIWLVDPLATLPNC